MERPVLVIRISDVAVNGPCELCGQRTEPEFGPELFVEGTSALVCRGCGEDHAPELVRYLEAYRDRVYAEAEQEQLEREISGHLTPTDEELIDLREARLRREAIEEELRRRREVGDE